VAAKLTICVYIGYTSPDWESKTEIPVETRRTMMRFVWLVVIASAATVGLRAAEPSSEVIYFDHDKAAAVFAKGGILLDKGVYQIRPGRRTEPGAVETHLEYT